MRELEILSPSSRRQVKMKYAENEDESHRVSQSHDPMHFDRPSELYLSSILCQVPLS